MDDKWNLIQQTINNKQLHTENLVTALQFKVGQKVDSIHQLVVSNKNETNASFNNIQSNIDHKILDMKSELVSTKIEMRDISETQKTLSAVILNINNNTLVRKISFQPLSTTTLKDYHADETMIDIKAHGGMRVTRSQTANK
jgi:hypothetical protein